MLSLSHCISSLLNTFSSASDEAMGCDAELGESAAPSPSDCAGPGVIGGICVFAGAASDSVEVPKTLYRSMSIGALLLSPVPSVFIAWLGEAPPAGSIDSSRREAIA